MQAGRMPLNLGAFAVLSQDIFTMPLQALPATTSALTIVGGRVVRDGLTRTASHGSGAH
jgi:hypothetical protein